MIPWLEESIHRVRSFFPSTKMDQDLDREMAAHLELAVDENIRRGMPAEEARRQALIRFGGVEQAKEQHREARGFRRLISCCRTCATGFAPCDAIVVLPWLRC